MTKLRVLVVEDSLTVRKYLVATLAAEPDIEVVGEASDGKTAIELCQSLRPDVVTLDMILPVMTGLAATEHIMAYCPTPILIVSSSTNRGDLFKTYDALSAGAVDVLDKPSGDELDSQWERKLIAAVKLVARIRVITHPRGRLTSFAASRASARTALADAHPVTATASAATATAEGRNTTLIVIGASTGGPAAIAQIAAALPATFPIPIVLVLHIGRVFANGFVEWLAQQSAIPVAHAEEGAAVPPVGRPSMLVAPPDRHLAIRGGRFRLLDAPERHSCRPAVDELFESVAREMGPSVVAAVLTGMGRDGASGLLAIRAAGGVTIVQDEASSVVFGMPREAIRIGAAQRILALTEIAPSLIAIAQHAQSERDVRPG